jgi:hypothetical protein
MISIIVTSRTARRDLGRHQAFVRQFAGSAPGEDEAARTLDLAAGADIVDVLIAAPQLEREGPADPASSRR